MIKRLIIYVSMVNCIGVSYGQTISLVDNQTASVLSNLLAGKGIQVAGGFTLNCNSSANGTFVNVNPTPNLSLAIAADFATPKTATDNLPLNFSLNSTWSLPV